MRIALITTPTRTYMPNTTLPVGVMYLASYLEDNGHTVKIFDVARTRQVNQITINELNEFKPYLIGISGIITAYKFIKLLVADLKKSLPRIPIVIGGHITIDNAELLLRRVGCDYVIDGYGEKALLYLAEHIAGEFKIEDVPGLSYLKYSDLIQNKEHAFFDNLDDIPLPAYQHIDMEYYVTVNEKFKKLDLYLAKTGKPCPPMRSATVIGARGCTDRCVFCVHEFAYKGFHVHSTNYIINNMKILYERFGVRIFGIGEDLFLHNARQATEFANAMNKHFPDAYFSCTIRSDFVTPELVDALKRSNCYNLAYGFESGSNKILTILGKRVTREINLNAYKIIKETDIVPACSFMVGSPGETKETLKDTIEAIKEAVIVDSAVFFTTPYPGSRLFRWAQEQELIKDTESYLDLISNRDATEFSINLTRYPDIIVKMMQVLVQNEWEKNKKITLWKFIFSFKRLIKRLIVPLVYEFYFIWRNLMDNFFKSHNEDERGIDFNRQCALVLSSEMDNVKGKTKL